VSRRSWPRLRAGALLTALAVGACGIPAEDEPRPIAQDALPEDLASDGSAEVDLSVAPTSASENVFVVRTDPVTEEKRLEGFLVDMRNIPDPDTKDLLDALLSLRPSTVDDSLSNAIPDEVTLRLDPDGTTAIIELSEEIDNAQGETQRLAFAQLVYTATELGAFDAVEFEREGEPLSVPTDDGTTAERVDRSDYEEFSPTTS
jgi:hypothetical protein